MRAAESMRSLAVVIGCATMFIQCRRDASANQTAKVEPDRQALPAPTATPPAAGEDARGASAKAEFDESPFKLRIQPKSKIARGQSGEVAIILSAKSPFHVNQEYPHRFKVTSLRGLTTPANVVQRDPKRMTPGQLEVIVPVTAGQDETIGIDGELSFSLCTDEKCLMEKRNLTLSVTTG